MAGVGGACGWRGRAVGNTMFRLEEAALEVVLLLGRELGVPGGGVFRALPGVRAVVAAVVVVLVEVDGATSAGAGVVVVSVVVDGGAGVAVVMVEVDGGASACGASVIGRDKCDASA